MALATVPSPNRDWFKEPCMLGIDEAGRGPVLGPMVYGCAYCPISQKKRIGALEFADSKTLSEAKREQLYAAIVSDALMGWAVDVISPEAISASMLRMEKRSLNAISFDSAFGLIQGALDRGVNLQQVFVDTVGDETKYEARLGERFRGIAFTVRKKADSLFPIVSAASIMAKALVHGIANPARDAESLRNKPVRMRTGFTESDDVINDLSMVTRDRSLKRWTSEGPLVGRSFGTGYPGDDGTKQWLVDHVDCVFGFPSLVRFSWATCRPLMEAACAAVYWEGEEEDDSGAAGSKRRRSAKVQFESSAPTRHSFFRSRHLQAVTTKL